MDFRCKLGEQDAREITLTNPTRRALSYTVRLEGQAESFVLSTSVVTIDPGSSVQARTCRRTSADAEQCVLPP